jgi:Concanavalin A-like lectin/glucanases superfamily
MRRKPSILESFRVVAALLPLALMFVSSAQAQSVTGFALGFDGSTNYVAISHTAALNSFPLTVMAWVQTASTNGQQGLVTKYVSNSLNGWNLFLRDGHVRAWYFVNNSRYVWDGTNGLDGGIIGDGLWHHLALAVDAGGGRLYVDGVLKDSRAWTGGSGSPATIQEVRLGNYPGGLLGAPGPILLDEISLWRAALSQSQIQTNMNRSLTGSEADLIAYYPCDEGSGTTLGDIAPLDGNNIGTLVNGRASRGSSLWDAAHCPFGAEGACRSQETSR